MLFDVLLHMFEIQINENFPYELICIWMSSISPIREHEHRADDNND